MKIKKLEMCNFRSVSKIQFEFREQLNLFVGLNGSGKSTILDALSICLSWLVKRIESENGRGNAIKDSDLKNDEVKGYLDIDVTENGNDSHRWYLKKVARGQNEKPKQQLSDSSSLAKIIKDKYKETESLPVIAYYSVNRVVKERIQPSMLNRGSVYDLDIYENALGGNSNYKSFFEWFRSQNEILNLRDSSRSNWMKKNRNWTKRKVNKILALLKETIFEDEKYYDKEEFKYLIERFEKDELIYEEPKFLFREISHLIDRLSMMSHKNYKYEKVFHDLEYMFHKMGSLSNDSRDNLISDGGQYEEIIEHITHNLTKKFSKKNIDEKLIDFIWETFTFANLLSLWWLSDINKKLIEREFRDIAFRFGKDKLFINFETISENILKVIKQAIKKEINQKKNARRNEGNEIRCVRNAIEKFIPEYTDLRIELEPRPQMIIDKNGKTFNLEQLSDGEKNLIALVGDIARRLSLGNPTKNKPLEGEGIILIDEIDLHLHPSWQRRVIPKLLEVFPNCQFFISTHSPQVISHTKAEDVFLLKQTDNGMTFSKVNETYGMSIERIVSLIMDDIPRPEEVIENFDVIFELIERDKLEEAKEIIQKIKKNMKTDPEIMRAESLIRMRQMQR